MCNDQKPVCKVLPSTRRNADIKSGVLPSHDPYIPQKFQIFYNCTGLTCEVMHLTSLTQITEPSMVLKGCYKAKDKFDCQNVRYNHMKNIDKLLFLNSNINDKRFYGVDCLVYDDGGKVCHSKDDTNDIHVKLIDTGAIVRPNETNILSQDEFICEESIEGYVNCDANSFISFNDKLVLREAVMTDAKVLLKTGNFVVPLQKNCILNWCGYSGLIIKSARRARYEPPGGKVYRCYYANKQQICKRIPNRNLYLDRNADDIYNFQAG
ncbi:uncharacterized protein LOC106136741 [Amyelois transitella]|uniref:uncharacterized protein LOC106136741 n=1 Tax=Amyelois transitella TaxID=680683 RepID=UPI0029907FB0|nr:uncharacterized protein LOC106136741 [Amyelois transitella]